MIYIDKNSHESFYMQIYSQIKEGILSGKIVTGEKLPGIRSLSKDIGVARNTVEKAYAQLSLEGYIESKPGSGFVVQNTGIGFFIHRPDKSDIGGIKEEAKREKYKYDFQYGALPMDKFPVKLWKQYTANALSSMVSEKIDQYQDNLGDYMLREELKKYLYRSRGVICSSEQIIVSCGLHYCIEIICRLLGEKKTIAFEEPGYLGPRDVFIKNNYTIEPIYADEKGIDLSSLNASKASGAYVTCSHQFPYGTVMSIKKRRQLLQWASENDAYIIEDDYDSEFRYDSNPVPSLQSIDKFDRVIYVGTFSKSLSPSMRVNYLVLPNRLLPKYHERYKGYACPVSWITQRILASFIENEDYERHTRKMAIICKKKHDKFVQIAEQLMGDKIRLYGKGSGLHFIMEFPSEQKQDRLIEKAAVKGVKVYPTKPFWNNKSMYKENTLFMGYGMMTELEIEEGLKILHKAWF